MYLHVRATWEELPRQDTLMLWVEEDAGSLWMVERIDGGYFSLRTKRASGLPAGGFLHVRETWEDVDPKDALMLHANSDSHGSHWRIAPGPTPGTSYLANRRSGSFLTVRRNWASERKGDHLAIAAPAADNLSVWTMEPAAPAGDPDCVLLQSPSAIVRADPTRDVGPGKKFAWDGGCQRFPGFSVVASVSPAARATLRAGMEAVGRSAKGRSLLSKPLPLGSLHMTVCGFNNVGGLPIREDVYGVLGTFRREVRQSGQPFRACGVSVRNAGSRKAIKLDVGSIEPRAPFERLRMRLTGLCGEQEHSPRDGSLHITFGFYELWKAPENQENIVDRSLDAACREINAGLRQMNHEVPLELPHLSNYDDMASFPDNC